MALQTKTFTYGSLAYGSVTKGYILELTLTEAATDPAANASQVDYSLRLRSGGNNRFSNYGLGATVTLDGAVVATRDRYTAPQVSLGYHSSVTLLSGSAHIPHGADGTKTMAVAFAIDMATGSYVPGPVSVTGETMALTPIPRASTLGAADAAIGAVCPISVNRKNSAYSHTIAWAFGSLSGYIGADWQACDTPVRLTDTAISFPVPEGFYSQIPDSKSGICTLTVTTYSGDTQIGEPQMAQFTARAEESLCAPTVSGTVTDINDATLALTADPKALVKFFSTARCVLEAQGKNGATLADTRIAGISARSLDIPAVETADIPFEATDSRGYSTSATDGGARLIDYIRLTCNPRLRWVDATGGVAELQLTGDWFSGSFGAQDNALTVACSVDGGPWQPVSAVIDGDSYTASVQLEGLSYQEGHTVTVTAEDKLDCLEKTLSLGRGIPVFDWGAQDFVFHVPVHAPVFLAEGQELATKAYVQQLLQTGST